MNRRRDKGFVDLPRGPFRDEAEEPRRETFLADFEESLEVPVEKAVRQEVEGRRMALRRFDEDRKEHLRVKRVIGRSEYVRDELPGFLERERAEVE